MFIDDRSVQRALKSKGFYVGEIDGIFGRGSQTAARKSISIQGAAAWSNERVRIAVEQTMFKELGLYTSAIDGLIGPATQIARERWQDHITFERPSPDPTAGVSKATVWPTQATMAAFYGPPGTNHTRITPPYPVFYGDQRVQSILINAKCAESASRILAAVLAHYGEAKIHELGLDRFGGCYNNRPMRNGTRLSTHAFAAAWDWDAARNPLRAGRDRAQMAKPEYAAFIDAHEAEGWISLGRARNMDFMHFQAVRL